MQSGGAAAEPDPVPGDIQSDGSTRFVWDLPCGRILIEVAADGAVAVNGRAVEPAPLRPASGRR
jgi:hypothetical protein